MATILGSIIVFLLVVLLHEGGHFMAAKASDIKVNEFAVGMGPKIFQKKKGETLYTLRAIPMGGYCAMEGEDSHSQDSRSFGSAPVYKRMIVVVAGAFMNFVLAIVIFTITSLFLGVQTTQVASLMDNMPAKSAGIMPGDRIVSIDNKETKTFAEIIDAINDSKNDQVEVKVLSDGIDKEFKVNTFKDKEGRKLIGFTPIIKRSLLTSISAGFKTTFQVVEGVFKALSMLITGKAGLNNLSGPVGVIKTIGKSTKQGIISLLFITGLISANLGVINLLPIPALDGGKFVLLLVEAIRKKPVNEKFETFINLAGFVFLIGLMIFITVFVDLRR